MKNCKTFYETQTASRHKEIIQPPPTPYPTNKILLRLWNKNFLREMYRNIQTFAFKVLQKFSSWASLNGAVQFFFWHQTETYLLENFVKWKVFWLCFESILFLMSSELKFVKQVKFFEWHCIVKWVIFFASFYWLRDFLLENLE